MSAPLRASADEEAPRCPACGGYYREDGQCAECGLTAEQAEDETADGRYVVYAVHGDGNPREQVRMATLAGALTVRDAIKWQALGTTSFYGVVDSCDEERGWLSDDSFTEGVDAGPWPM